MELWKWTHFRCVAKDAGFTGSRGCGRNSVLFCSKFKKPFDEFDAHERFVDDWTPELGTEIIRVWVKGFCSVKFHWNSSCRQRGDGAQLFSHLSRSGSSLWRLGSSQVSTNALRGFSLNGALGSPRWWEWSPVLVCSVAQASPLLTRRDLNGAREKLRAPFVL